MTVDCPYRERQLCQQPAGWQAHRLLQLLQLLALVRRHQGLVRWWLIMASRCRKQVGLWRQVGLRATRLLSPVLPLQVALALRLQGLSR